MFSKLDGTVCIEGAGIVKQCFNLFHFCTLHGTMSSIKFALGASRYYTSPSYPQAWSCESAMPRDRDGETRVVTLPNCFI